MILFEFKYDFYIKIKNFCLIHSCKNLFKYKSLYLQQTLNQNQIYRINFFYEIIKYILSFITGLSTPNTLSNNSLFIKKKIIINYFES